MNTPDFRDLQPGSPRVETRAKRNTAAQDALPAPSGRGPEQSQEQHCSLTPASARRSPSPVSPQSRQGASGADPISAGLFEAGQDCVKIIDLDGRLLSINANGLCLMDIDDFSLLQGQAWELFWPEVTRAEIRDAVNQAARGGVARFTAECATAKGTLKIWDVIVAPVCDATGHATQIISISQDITEQRRTLERTSLMSLELSHRIKNVFAVVDGVISLSARSEPGLSGFVDKLRRRLNDLGRATSYVSPVDVGREGLPVIPTLRGLLATLLEPYGATEGPDRQVNIEGADCPVGQSATTAIALVINELATNALKYGALRSPGGRISLTLTAVDAHMKLVWKEAGQAVGNGPKAASDGFGTSLLHNTVVRLLRGSLQREWLPNGLRVSIQAPKATLLR